MLCLLSLLHFVYQLHNFIHWRLNTFTHRMRIAQAQVQTHIIFSIIFVSFNLIFLISLILFYFRIRPDGLAHRTELVFRVDDNLSNFLVDRWCCRWTARSVRNSINTNCIWTVVSAHVDHLGGKKWKLPYWDLYGSFGHQIIIIILLLLLLSVLALYVVVSFAVVVFISYYWVTIAIEDKDTWCRHRCHRRALYISLFDQRVVCVCVSSMTNSWKKM